jgi:hypothetical protein
MISSRQNYDAWYSTYRQQGMSDEEARQRASRVSGYSIETPPERQPARPTRGFISGFGQGAREGAGSLTGAAGTLTGGSYTPIGRTLQGVGATLEGTGYTEDLTGLGKAGRAIGRLGVELGSAMVGGGALLRGATALPRVGTRVSRALESGSRLQRGAAYAAAGAPIDALQAARVDEGFVLPGRVGAFAENVALSGLAGGILPARRGTRGDLVDRPSAPPVVDPELRAVSQAAARDRTTRGARGIAERARRAEEYRSTIDPARLRSAGRDRLAQRLEDSLESERRAELYRGTIDPDALRGAGRARAASSAERAAEQARRLELDRGRLEDRLAYMRERGAAGRAVRDERLAEREIARRGGAEVSPREVAAPDTRTRREILDAGRREDQLEYMRQRGDITRAVRDERRGLRDLARPEIVSAVAGAGLGALGGALSAEEGDVQQAGLGGILGGALGGAAGRRFGPGAVRNISRVGRQELLSSAVGAGIGGLAAEDTAAGALTGAAVGAGLGYGARRLGGARQPEEAGSFVFREPGVMGRETARVDVPFTPTATPTPRAVELVDEWFNIPRFNLSDEAEAVFRENAARVIQGNPDLLARRSVSFEEMRAAAKEIGMRGSDADLQRIFNSDRLRGVDIIVARDVINTTATDTAALLARRGQLGLSENQIRLIDAEIENLTAINNALLVNVARESSARGRDLAMNNILARYSLDDFTWLSKAKRAVGSRGLTTDETSKVISLTAAAREGSEEAKNQLITYVSSLQRAGVGQQASAVWKAALLSMPRTVNVNVIGNTTNAALRATNRPVAAFWDHLISTALGTQKTTAWIADVEKAGLMGARQGYREGIVMMGGKALRQAIKEGKGLRAAVTDWDQAMRTGNYTSVLQKYDINNRVNIGNKPLDLVTKVIFGLQGASDMPFRSMAHASTLSELAHVTARNSGLRRGTPEYAAAVNRFIENPPDWMAIQALESAMEAVFAGNTRLASMFGGLKNVAARSAQSENPITSSLASTLDFFIPFTRVPSGVATEVVMHSPLGFARASEYLVDLLRTKRAGTPEEIFKVQRQLAHALAKSTTGTGLWLAGYWMASQGMLSGRRPTSPGEATQQAEEGGMPFSFQIGDRYYSIPKALSPIGGSLALGAVMYDVVNNDDVEGWLQQVAAMGTGVGAMAVETTALGGIQDMLAAATDPRAAGRRVENIVSTALVPQVVAGTARAFDPTVRETEGVRQAIQARIPIASRSLPARLDRFGRPISRGESFGERIGQVSDPFYSRPDRRGDDEVLAELGRVGVTAFGPRRAARGETREQVRERVEFEGPMIYERLERMMRSPSYQNRPLAQARQIIARDPAYAGMDVEQVADELRREMLEREISRIRASSTRTLRRRGEIQ